MVLMAAEGHMLRRRRGGSSGGPIPARVARPQRAAERSCGDAGPALEALRGSAFLLTVMVGGREGGGGAARPALAVVEATP